MTNGHAAKDKSARTSQPLSFCIYCEVFLMSSFSMVIMEEGVEVEIPGDLSEIISLLDQEVPYFSCDSHMYQLTPTRIEVGKRWELIIKAIDQTRRDQPPFQIAWIEVEPAEDDRLVFRIPPRDRDPDSEAMKFDPMGKLYGAFAFNCLNVFQERNYIELPGVLPTI